MNSESQFGNMFRHNGKGWLAHNWEQLDDSLWWVTYKKCESPSHQKIGDFRLPAILPKPRECSIFLGKDSSFRFSLSRPGLPCEVDSKDRELLKVQAPPAGRFWAIWVW